MRTLSFALVLLLAAAPSFSNDVFTPAANISTDGIPPIPRELIEKIDRYSNYRSAAFAQWHPDKLEMLIGTRFGVTSQVHRVAQPMGMREQLTFFPEPVRGVGEYVDGNAFTLSMDAGGDEFFQLYRFDPATGARTLLTDGKSRHTMGPRSKATGIVAFHRVDADADGAFTEIWTVDPLKPETARKVATMRGGGWGTTDWSPDGKQLLLNEYISVTNSKVWLLDVTSGESKRLLPKDDSVEISYSGGEFDPSGAKFYCTSDEGSEFAQLRVYSLSDLSSESLTAKIPWDVDEFDLSPNGNMIAYAYNDAGSTRWGVMPTGGANGVTIAPSGGALGVASGFQWHNDSDHLAFTKSDVRSAGDVWVLQASTGKVTQWTKSETGISTEGWPDAEPIRWKSSDGLDVTGFLNRPPAKFSGPRPCVVVIHGGPEGQSRPNFQGRWNYFLNELGIAIIYPNVRGSTGFGKTFAGLDNGTKRGGTYDDIGALLDWIGAQPELDAKRIMIYGGSYGGHMTLATATRYSEKIACSVNLFGISNFVTFLANTQGYRRDLRRAEYGDERDPETFAWMQRTAPMAHVDQIRKPMLVQQGVNDPRVPKSESDQIVAALKKSGTPVWYLVFEDEGHGFAKKPNADFAFYTTALFAQEYLLGN